MSISFIQLLPFFPVVFCVGCASSDPNANGKTVLTTIVTRFVLVVAKATVIWRLIWMPSNACGARLLR